MITLEIHQTYAQIGIETQRAPLDLQSKRPEIIIHSEPAKVEITPGKATLSIDQTAFRESYGIKTQTQLSIDNAKAGREALFSWIGKLAEEGARLGAIEKGGNPIVEMAREAISKPLPDVTFARLERPEIRFNVTPTRFNVTPHRVNVELRRGEVINNTQKTQVNIYLAQRNSISISTTGTVDTKV